MALLLFGLGALTLACSSREPVEDDDPYSEFDHDLRERLGMDLPQPGQRDALFGNFYYRDRPEFAEYVELFRSSELGPQLRQELIRYATQDPDPFLRANICYLLVLAGFTEVHGTVLANLEHDEQYLRYRAVLSLPFIIGSRQAQVLLPLIGKGEPIAEVRQAARGVYRDLVGPDQLGEVFVALRESGEDKLRAEFLGEVFGELLDATTSGQRERKMQELGQHFGEGNHAVDAFALRRLEGAFTVEFVPALARIVATVRGDRELRRAAHAELVRMLGAGGTLAQAVREQAQAARLPVLADLEPNRANPVFAPDEVFALVNSLGLDRAGVGALQSQVMAADLREWRDTDHRDRVAAILLANHAPRSPWLTQKLVEAMHNPDILPAASQALLRYALELSPDSPEQNELVTAAKRGLTGRRDVALRTAEALAALGSEAAIDALLAGMEESNPDVVEVCADALLSLADSKHLIEKRYHTLWNHIRESNRHLYEPYHTIHTLRILEEIGNPDEDLQFFDTYGGIDTAITEVREAFEQARLRIIERAQNE